MVVLDRFFLRINGVIELHFLFSHRKRGERYMNGAGSIALFNTDAMKWKTTAMPMLYIYMYGRTKVWLLFLDVDLPPRPADTEQYILQMALFY